MKWLYKFMYGRYGGDDLNFVLLILSIIFSFLRFVFNPFLILSYICLILCILRMFSKNIYKRRSENDKYLKLTQPLRKTINRNKNRWRDRKTHKYFKCPTCHQYLRVPKGRGKIEITCPHCKNHFERKT
jgi:predicted membrane protein